MDQDSNPLHPTQLPAAAPSWPLHPAMVTTDVALPGFQIVRTHGIVRGCAGRSAGVSGGVAAIGQAFGSGAGASLQKLIDVHEQAQAEAFFLLLQRAAQVGANAIIGFCYIITESASITVLAYGTAVWAEPL